MKSENKRITYWSDFSFDTMTRNCAHSLSNKRWFRMTIVQTNRLFCHRPAHTQSKLICIGTHDEGFLLVLTRSDWIEMWILCNTVCQETSHSWQTDTPLVRIMTMSESMSEVIFPLSFFLSALRCEWQKSRSLVRTRKEYKHFVSHSSRTGRVRWWRKERSLFAVINLERKVNQSESYLHSMKIPTMTKLERQRQDIRNPHLKRSESMVVMTHSTIRPPLRTTQRRKPICPSQLCQLRKILPSRCPNSTTSMYRCYWTRWLMMVAPIKITLSSLYHVQQKIFHQLMSPVPSFCYWMPTSAWL